MTAALRLVDGDSGTTLDDVADVVRREIRTAALLDAPAPVGLPPCCDLEAERVVVAAAFGQQVELDPYELFHGLHRVVLAACQLCHQRGTVPTVGICLEALRRQGYHGPDIENALHEIVAPPAYGRATLTESLAIVRKLAVRRALRTAAGELMAMCTVDAPSGAIREAVQKVARIAGGQRA